METKPLTYEYDPEADAGYIRLSDATVDRTVDLEREPLGLTVLADLDGEGRIIGFEILSAQAIVGNVQ